MNWRDHLPIHPAAELFPLMSEVELREHAEDIKANGLRVPLVGWAVDGQSLLDGRNRLDALAQLGLLYETGDHHVGLKKWDGKQWIDQPGGRIGYAPGCEFHNLYDGDPYAIVLSLNVHRRHLNAEQKRELITKVLKLQPEKSDRQIAKEVGVTNKTVGVARRKAELREEIPHVETRTDTKGRKQLRRPRKPKPTPAFPPIWRNFIDAAVAEPEPSAEDSAEQRRAYYAATEEPADKPELDKKPNPTNRFANIANDRKRAVRDALTAWVLLPKEGLQQVFEAIGVSRILASLPDAWLPAVAQWVAERQSLNRENNNSQSREAIAAIPPPPQAERRPGQDDLSIPASLQRVPS